MFYQSTNFFHISTKEEAHGYASDLGMLLALGSEMAIAPNPTDPFTPSLVETMSSMNSSEAEPGPSGPM